MAKTTAKVETPKVETAKVEETKVEETPKVLGEQPVVEELVVGAGENDTAIAESKPESTFDDASKVEMDDSKESKKAIKEDEKVKEAVANGEIAGLTPAQTSVLMQGLVPDLHTGKPVYPTNEAAMLALSASGKLSTPSE